MDNIIGHIIGMDEIHKKKLVKSLPTHIKIIDLDDIQQTVYNDKDIVNNKLIWGEIGKEILVRKRQNNLLGSKKSKPNTFDKQVKKLTVKRNNIRKKIHELWKDKMTNQIEKETDPQKHILFVGFNIFPKDYRVKIGLPIQNLVEEPDIFNKIFFDTKPYTYAANQIKYYLKTYPDKIVNGSFNLSLLNAQYLASKYEKFSEYYHKQGYNPVSKYDIKDLVLKLDKKLLDKDKISHKNIYIATLFRANGLIPVNSKTPLEGFLSRENAIANIKTKTNKNTPIYIYQSRADQFQLVDGKLMATQQIDPIEEESILLTI